jgi:hypothetical protein
MHERPPVGSYTAATWHAGQHQGVGRAHIKSAEAIASRRTDLPVVRPDLGPVLARSLGDEAEERVQRVLLRAVPVPGRRRDLRRLHHGVRHIHLGGSHVQPAVRGVPIVRLLVCVVQQHLAPHELQRAADCRGNNTCDDSGSRGGPTQMLGSEVSQCRWQGSATTVPAPQVNSSTRAFEPIVDFQSLLSIGCTPNDRIPLVLHMRALGIPGAVSGQ